jgi:hypothetical protein
MSTKLDLISVGIGIRQFKFIKYTTERDPWGRNLKADEIYEMRK